MIATMREDVAEIFDALGRADLAARLRWDADPEQQSRAELEEERDALERTLTDTENRLERLEALLCKRCAAKSESSS